MTILGCDALAFDQSRFTTDMLQMACIVLTLIRLSAGWRLRCPSRMHLESVLHAHVDQRLLSGPSTQADGSRPDPSPSPHLARHRKTRSPRSRSEEHHHRAVALMPGNHGVIVPVGNGGVGNSRRSRCHSMIWLAHLRSVQPTAHGQGLMGWLNSRLLSGSSEMRSCAGTGAAFSNGSASIDYLISEGDQPRSALRLNRNGVGGPASEYADPGSLAGD
jgi:hypothetical protein